MRNLAGFRGPCLAHSNSSLALSCDQESAATQCTLNESLSFGTSVTGGRVKRRFVDGHSERGKADTVEPENLAGN